MASNKEKKKYIAAVKAADERDGFSYVCCKCGSWVDFYGNHLKDY